MQILRAALLTALLMAPAAPAWTDTADQTTSAAACGLPGSGLHRRSSSFA